MGEHYGSVGWERAATAQDANSSTGRVNGAAVPGEGWKKVDSRKASVPQPDAAEAAQPE